MIRRVRWRSKAMMRIDAGRAHPRNTIRRYPRASATAKNGRIA
jgi:hypothetical protein